MPWRLKCSLLARQWHGVNHICQMERCACSQWTRTVFLRGSDEDYTMSTRGRLLERMRVILGGRAAEEVGRAAACASVLACPRL